MMTDADYIQGFYSNNNATISHFYRENERAFKAYFRERFGKSDDYLDDLFQESCVVMWQNISSGKLSIHNLTSSLSTYFTSIGKYSLMAKDRKYKEIANDTEIQKLGFVEDDAQELEKRIERESFVDRMVGDMKPPCSQILQMFYFDKKKGEEIAEAMGYANTDTVKTQKYKCMQKLKPLLAKFNAL